MFVKCITLLFAVTAPTPVTSLGVVNLNLVNKSFAFLRESSTREAAADALAQSRFAAPLAPLLARARMATGGVTASSPPQQLHLSPGPDPLSSARVTWVSYDRVVDGSAQVQWRSNASMPQSSATAHAATYSAGEGGWAPNGTILSAVMTALQSGVSYTYTVGAGSAMSDPRDFTLPPAPSASASLRLAVTADMGTIVPLGWAVADRLAEDHLISGRFDAVVLVGDLSYATIEPSSCSPTNPSCDEVEWTWDAFGLQTEPYASTAMLISSVGNHDHVPGNFTPLYPTPGLTQRSDFAAFSARYTDQVGGGNGSFWSSVDLGPVHYVVASTEHDFAPGSPQADFLEADLQAVDRSTTPWVFVALHRPVMSASVLEFADHSPGAKLSAAFEPLFRRHSVDLCIAGHIHSYEYTFPVFNGTVLGGYAPGTENTTMPTFVDPPAPIYVVQGTSGALPENVFFDPAPAWSAKRFLGSFGYGRVTVTGAEHLLWEFVGLYGEVLDAWAVNKTSPPQLRTVPPFVTSLLSYGGVGDGSTDNTAAFVAGVAAVFSAGGGTLIVPSGRFLTSAFNLTHGMTLLLGEGATILGSTDYDAWPLVGPLPSFNDGPRYAPLIGGVGLTGVKILGNWTTPGAALPTIDGQGLAWEAASALKKLKGQRPHAIELNACDDVEIAGILVYQSAFWSVHPVYSTRVYIHDMEVLSAVPNGDGIDPDGCDGVVIDRVALTTGDDAIAIKSGTQGPEFPPANNITIKNSVLSSSEACIAIGSEMTAGVSNVEVGPNVTCTLGGHGLLYVKETRKGGGYVRNVLVHDVRLSGVFGKFLWLSQHFGENGEKQSLPLEDGGLATSNNYPAMANITMRDVMADGAVFVEAAVIAGDLPAPGNGTGAILNVTLLRINLGASVLGGWTCANASVSFEDVTPPPSSTTCPQLTQG